MFNTDALMAGMMETMILKRKMKAKAEALEPGGYMDKITDGIDRQVDRMFDSVDLGDSEDSKMYKGFKKVDAKILMLKEYTGINMG